MRRQKPPVPVNSAGTRIGFASYFHSALSARLVRLGCSWGLVRSNSINYRQPKSLCIGRPSSHNPRVTEQWQQVRGQLYGGVYSSRALTSLVHKGRRALTIRALLSAFFFIQLDMGPRNLAVVSEDGEPFFRNCPRVVALAVVNGGDRREVERHDPGWIKVGSGGNQV